MFKFFVFYRQKLYIRLNLKKHKKWKTTQHQRNKQVQDRPF